MSGHVLNRARLPLPGAMFDVLIRHGKLTVIDAVQRTRDYIVAAEQRLNVPARPGRVHTA
jgi:hypothetical protein